MLARFATRIATGYEETAQALGTKAVITGCPVRAEFQYVAPRTPERALSHPDHRRQSGRAPHQSCGEDALPHLAERRKELAIVHQTGEREFEDVRALTLDTDFMRRFSPS